MNIFTMFFDDLDAAGVRVIVTRATQNGTVREFVFHRQARRAVERTAKSLRLRIKITAGPNNLRFVSAC